ncbi:MAG: alkaline phosphatase [Bacteroides sp.]|nr:alkaline phosphatase [Bacteroides sp.]
MKKKLYHIFSAVAALTMSASVAAQSPMMIHSHNDYTRVAPFYEAYSQKASSIEADVFLKGGRLLVGHELEDLSPEMSFDRMYFQPIVSLFKINGGRAWKDSDGILQLMVEIKSETAPAMKVLVAMLKKYPEVFNPDVNPNAVRVVITGNVPSPADFSRYPDYISFDGIIDEEYTPEQLERVALFSTNFRAYSTWNGKGAILPAEREELMKVIDYAHGCGRPIRFWNAPEGTTVYYTFLNMGIDYLNTDMPATCAAFYSDFGNKNFCIGDHIQASAEGVTGTKKLDKTTRDFSGFRDDKMVLSKNIDIYAPTYASDAADRPVKNIIFLIGDGMGLNQITAGAYANRGLSLLNMRYMGLQINQAADSFTTDSAAGGSALATGEPHNNRHISMSPDGVPYPSLSDFFHDMGKSIGVVSLGNIVDATPAAFYGHCTERDSSDVLTRYLLDGKVDVLCGSGIDQFEKRNDGLNIVEMLSGQYSFIRSADGIKGSDGKVICIDESMGEAAEEANLCLLADVTRSSIAKLQERSDKGFFLMVEGAKIDYAGHSRCLPGSVIEMLSFDMAVAEAMKFADEDGETLVVVTADHETGGLSIVDGDEKTGRILGVYISDDHTPAMLPVFAYGPGADRFIGVYMNTEIPKRIKELAD